MSAKISAAIALGLAVFFILYSIPFSAARGETETLLSSKYINKKYLMLLFVFPYPWPEFVDLTLSDNGTFSLKSDFYDVPSLGTYNKNSFVVRGTGTSVKYFDLDYDEEVQVAYEFVGLPLGFRNFFMLGTGLRNIHFHSDNHTISENFVFEGPGFKNNAY